MHMPKRVWSNKKLVYSNHKPVWKLDDKLGVYDSKFKEINTGETYTDERENLDGDAELQIYDSLTPTNIGTMEDGIIAEYKFVDYDQTLLKSGTVKDGEIPVAPADPIREATAEYTYTFSGRDPEVGPISENTTYEATYTATKNKYTITWLDYDETEIDTTEVEYGVIPTHEDPTREGYTFSGRSPEVVAVTEAATYKATYTENVEPEEIL